MANRKLDEKDRLDLLAALQGLKGGAADGQGDVITTFLPLPSHGGALHEQTLVVRGERGAGKTAFFRFLDAMKAHPKELRRLFPDARVPDSSWIEGFSEQGMAHPGTAVLAQFAQSADDTALRAFWMAHLAGRLHAEGVIKSAPPAPIFELWQADVNTPTAWARAAADNVGALVSWMDLAERELTSSTRPVVVTYDYLDRIGNSGAVQAKMAGALMAVWQSLTLRYRQLRAKVFLREDLFESSQRAYPDASKLRSRSVLLHWDVDSLYRVLLRRMGAHESLRHWIQDKIEFEQKGILGWVPPASSLGNRSLGEVLMNRMVGERMGRGEKKAFTYRWIPNRLQDAHQRIVPRSLLNLIGTAAEKALNSPKARFLRLLTPGDLSAALHHTSKTRIAELLEEHPMVQRLEQLRGLTVMLEASKVERRLAPPPGTSEDGTDGRAILEELLRLGVLSRRSDGRIDIPDIYRSAFDIKRRGSVAAAT